MLLQNLEFNAFQHLGSSCIPLGTTSEADSKTQRGEELLTVSLQGFYGGFGFLILISTTDATIDPTMDPIIAAVAMIT